MKRVPAACRCPVQPPPPHRVAPGYKYARGLDPLRILALPLSTRNRRTHARRDGAKSRPSGPSAVR
eukprot:4485640-Prymnesium_polylepis.2